jgi:hypothetical protein
MGRSRLAWAGSAVAPWGIALGLLVSITAQADQDPASATSGFSRYDASFGHADGARPDLIRVRFSVGSAQELSITPDEIEPNGALKPSHSGLPAINRTAKGDPFIALRPGFDAHTRLPVAAPGNTQAEADWPSDWRSPAATQAAPAPTSVYTDGATPALTLEIALNSATPRPTDTKLGVTLVAKSAPAPLPPGVINVFADTSKPNYAALIDPKDSARQMRCLAEAIYFESRSEPEAGQAAVAQVVLNRVRSGIFPTNVCGVVYQDANRPFACQFSFACEGKSLRVEEPGAWAVATRIAQEVVRGVNYDAKLVDAVNYHANYVYPFWAPSLLRVEKIGAHLFYAMKPGLYWAPGALTGRGDLPPLQVSAAK